MPQVQPTATDDVAIDAALRALADGNRRRILAQVRELPLAVGELADRLDLTQQATSHHLRALRSAGLVTEQRDGTRHLFVVRTDGFAAVRSYLDDFWPSHLAALKRAVEGRQDDENAADNGQENKQADKQENDENA